MVTLVRTIRLALKSLLLHKLRSGLTMLGIVFGVFSVIAMLAIGEGASLQVQKQVLELGATNIIVRSVRPPEDPSDTSGSFILSYGLKRADLDLITDTVAAVERAVPIREVSSEARYRHRTLNVRLVGCTADYKNLNRLGVARGRFVADVDQSTTENVAVIAHEVATTLFPGEDPIGRQLRVDSLPLRVIGVTAPRTATAAIGGSLAGQDFNKDIYIPIQTFFGRIGDKNIRWQKGSVSAEEVELSQITLSVPTREVVTPTAEVIRESLNLTHPESDFAVVVPLELLRQAEQIRTIFGIVLGSIAAISLLVGGIGIMNIMLATVTERTREIGIRRALGARRRDIIGQFLGETVVLAGTGGLVGIGCGLLTPAAFYLLQQLATGLLAEGVADSATGRLFTGMQPTVALWSLPLAFGISVGTGVAFGLYPARAAAMMDPIEALRRQ
ncbi:MAG: ABC transporter permease [Planctomycetota bacterium]